MEALTGLISFILHFDKHLVTIIQHYGAWTYALLFGIVFAETGLVVTPFLPGDSLLFAAGAVAAGGVLDIVRLFIILVVAAILGDSANYAIGKFFGHAILERYGGKLIKKEHLARTHSFYEKYGAKTIVLARFVPIVRTFAPFVAGIGEMSYRTFFTYNVVGGFLWVGACVLGGYFFGAIPVVKENFTIVVLAIIVISVLPVAIEVWRHKKGRSKQE